MSPNVVGVLVKRPWRLSSMNVLFRTILASFLLLLAACSANDDEGYESTDSHVWKTQTEALDKARNVEQLLKDTTDEKRREMERQTR